MEAGFEGSLLMTPAENGLLGLLTKLETREAKLKGEGKSDHPDPNLPPNRNLASYDYDIPGPRRKGERERSFWMVPFPQGLPSQLPSVLVWCLSFFLIR